MPRGVIFNSLGLYVGSCRKLVIIIIFRTRNEHKFTLWTISQTNVSSFRLNSLFKASSFARDPRNVIWFEAISPFIKLNNDGSSLGNPGPSSFRGIMRDSHGLGSLGSMVTLQTCMPSSLLSSMRCTIHEIISLDISS